MIGSRLKFSGKYVSEQTPILTGWNSVRSDTRSIYKWNFFGLISQKIKFWCILVLHHKVTKHWWLWSLLLSPEPVARHQVYSNYCSWRARLHFGVCCDVKGLAGANRQPAKRLTFPPTRGKVATISGPFQTFFFAIHNTFCQTCRVKTKERRNPRLHFDGHLTIFRLLLAKL